MGSGTSGDIVLATAEFEFHQYAIRRADELNVPRLEVHWSSVSIQIMETRSVKSLLTTAICMEGSWIWTRRIVREKYQVGLS